MFKEEIKSPDETKPFVLDDQIQELIEQKINSLYKADTLVKTYFNSIYSTTERELVILLQTNKKEVDLFSLNLDTKKPQVTKLCFKLDNKLIQPEFSSIHLHRNNTEICLFSKSLLAFINLSSLKDDKLTIDINHTSYDICFRQFKFSNFDSFFGVLLSNNTWRYYNTTSAVCENLIDLKTQNIVDFELGPLLDFGWQNFSVMFLENTGGIYYCCPIFPDKFNLPEDYIKNMKNNIRIRKDCEKYSDLKDIYENQNTIISIIEEGKINENQFIRKRALNTNKHSLEKFTIIDKRTDSDKIILTGEFEYCQIHILNIFPLVFLRINCKNIIEVLFCNNFINLTDKVSRLNKSEIYIIDSVFLKSDYSNKHVPKVLNISDTKVLISLGLDIIELDLSFVNYISKNYKCYYGQDLRINTRAKIIQIINFNENNRVGYYGVSKIDLSLLTIDIFERKIFVRTNICKDKQKDKLSLAEEIKNQFILKKFNFIDLETSYKK